jgi:hypothetical protein
MNLSGVARRIAWLSFGVLPTVVLLASIILSMIGTIVLDHDILGRDADGWPVMYKTPAIRNAVDAFHMIVVYALPPLIGVLFFVWGRRIGAARWWVLAGGVLVCTVGSFHVVEAVWTGVKGTSDLRLAIVDDATVAITRLCINLGVYAAAVAAFGGRTDAST